MNSSTNHSEFSPFYDPRDKGTPLTVGGKVFISLAVGSFYIFIQYLVMPDKSAFFSQYCWVLGVIISTCLMALYVSTDVFRSNLETIDALQGNSKLSGHIVQFWLNNSRFLVAGLSVATANTLVAHLLGIPGELHASPLALLVMYLGYFGSGFTAGMGLLAIFSVIVLYLKLAPELERSLDSETLDIASSLKQLSNSLWFFAILASMVGVLVSLYLFAVDWQLMHTPLAKSLFLFWISLPYLVAVSIVLIPSLVVGRQVSYFKTYRIDQLKQEKAKLHLWLKRFEVSDDESIIKRHREITEKLESLNTKIRKLEKLRSHNFDRSEEH